jgi:hypothetical protein
MGLAFAAYKYPDAYRVMCIFALPVLVIGGFLVLAIKIGDLNGSIKSIYHELPNIRKYALSDQLPYQISRLWHVGNFLRYSSFTTFLDSLISYFCCSSETFSI